MADKITEDELKAEKTEGFKVSARKTMAEYEQLGTLLPLVSCGVGL